MTNEGRKNEFFSTQRSSGNQEQWLVNEWWVEAAASATKLLLMNGCKFMPCQIRWGK